jgi:hypothetical protein
LIRWRGAVAAGINSKRGQAFLLEMWHTMNELPERKLIAHDLEQDDGAVCAIGSVGKARGIDMSKIDPEDREAVAKAFGISEALAAEIMFQNDEQPDVTRFAYMKLWIEQNLRPIFDRETD